MAPSRNTLRGLRVQIRRTHARLPEESLLSSSLYFSLLFFASPRYLSRARPTCVQFNRTDVPLAGKILRAPLNSFGPREEEGGSDRASPPCSALVFMRRASSYTGGDAGVGQGNLASRNATADTRRGYAFIT